VQFAAPSADRSAPVTADELRASIGRVSGLEVTVSPMHCRATG
jgi:hypothetical protein